jgi:uncharacterized protein (DUF302 family)/uncharacterized membrane protein YidH (DUF202 family)
MEPQQNYHASPADFLAVERTFLAWIRTGLALMALGFVLARFGLFLQEFNVVRPNLPLFSYGYSLWFGTVLILLGVLVSVLSLLRYLRLIGQLKSGVPLFGNASLLAVAVAIMLSVLGLAMSYYLVATRHTSTPNPSAPKEALMSEAATPAMAENGIVRIASRHSVADTVAKVESTLQAKNVKLFTVIDHSGEAEKVGLTMPSTKLLIFGNPKGGTPLMLTSPSVALDFPLKILVAEDATGKVWISYNSPTYLQQRHNLPANLLPNIAVIEVLANNAAQ